MADPEGSASNEVSGQGWQNPYVYNARYAVLIGGGDTDSSKNWACFWKDTKEMYNVLVNQYNYLPENVYLHFWNNQKGYKDSIYIDGPADWDVELEEYREQWGNGIKQNLDVLETKITKNDLLILFSTSHGGKKVGDEGWFEICDVEDGTSSTALCYAKPTAGRDLDREIDKLTCARAVLIFSACGSGNAIKGIEGHSEWNLKGENRIIITDTDKNEESYSEWFFGEPHEHSAFLYEGHVDYALLPDSLDTYYSGFLKNMGSTTTPLSVKHAYDKGCEAATNNRIVALGGIVTKSYESHPQIYLPDLAETTYW
jgi:hypothetical protein